MKSVINKIDKKMKKIEKVIDNKMHKFLSDIILLSREKVCNDVMIDVSIHMDTVWKDVNNIYPNKVESENIYSLKNIKP
jgi:translation elongation factor EF-Ts